MRHRDANRPFTLRRAARFAGAGAVLLALLHGTSPEGVQAAGGSVPYPEGYRDWTHVKSLVLEPGHPLFESFGGLHHVYINDRGLKALKSGQVPFPDGTVFVFDLLEAHAADHAISEGPRKIVGVMHKDSKKHAATGGWGFEGFKGDGRERAVGDGGESCFSCHAAQKERDYVFSAWRE